MYEGIMLHHSLTKDTGTVSWGAIRTYHVQNQGWSDIGYHAGIELVGNYLEILLGRPWNIPGAHCKEGNANRRFLGFCFVGNFDVDIPSDQLLYIAAERFFKPMFELAVAKRFIITHNQLAPYKTCPGTMFPVDKFKNMCGV